MANIARRLVPLFDRVLVQRIVPEAKTASGILLPESAAGPAVEGIVKAVGDGRMTESGELVPLALKAGDKVLLGEFGGTKVDDEHTLYREAEILGKLSD